MGMAIMKMKALACLVFLAGASGAAAHDALLTQALSRPALPAGELHGSLRTTTIVRGGKEPETEVETVDLDKSPDKALASYAELGNVIGSDAHLVSQAAGRTVYAFTTRRLPRGRTGGSYVHADSDGNDSDDLSDDDLFNGEAEVSIDAQGEPFISHLDLHLAKPKGNLLARTKKINVSYAFAPNATKEAMVTTAVSVHVDVRALLFVHRDVHAESVLLADAPP
ncbi:hypothetical protein [Dyella jiangningensis]|uniref:Uncharacterized protein n=1 Tax=Dyella jiangningensis TaxID=1379159 RepID=A0A328P869_9GAMM|nr:hypothetical protein [Dyella jiangningensis]RAO77533.1 hypothetical protein CA260_06575 [Dyella jiangningensis]